jgi:hypothetical protein
MAGVAGVDFARALQSKRADFRAITGLNAKRIALPPFEPALLTRGPAAHFRCQGVEADGLRVHGQQGQAIVAMWG